MKLFRTRTGNIVQTSAGNFAISDSWNSLLSREDTQSYLQTLIDAGTLRRASAPAATDLLAPAVDQEIWASGVTYQRSKIARMEEAKSAGGGDFYDRVYAAPRPELFFKSAGWRAVGTGDKVRIRKDSKWNVPEPELTLVIASSGKVIGYTIGNDMSSRDIEGENPLYLPQAKVYDGACALGPCVYLTDKPLDPETIISIVIRRGGKDVFAGTTPISRIVRPLPSLADWLCKEMSFPNGALLLTGTGIVPTDDFTLQPGDEVAITIGIIGTLTNTVA